MPNLSITIPKGGSVMDRFGFFIGIDLHKHFIQVCVINQEGLVVEEMRLPTIKEVIKERLKKYSHKAKTCLEATFCWWWLIDTLFEINLNPILANPKKLKLITSSDLKNDKIDAKKLAHLLRLNFLPTCYITPLPLRELKELLRYRRLLIKYRTSLKNRIHSLLDKLNIKHRFSDLFSSSGLLFLKNLSLQPIYKFSLNKHLENIEEINSHIKEIERKLNPYLLLPLFKEKITLLRTIPGIDKIASLTIVAEIGDIYRFPNHKKLASYSGLVSRIYETSDKTHYGKIKKEANTYLRNILLEAVPHLIKKDPDIYSYYQRILIKKGKNKARIAVARKLITRIFYMLKENKTYFELKNNKAEPSNVGGRNHPACRLPVGRQVLCGKLNPLN
jgi:transposase